jgi:cytoplasmic iron level regulating protein YaaA (DUF328/UPF0246 family)
VLILLPASEAKASAAGGRPLDSAGLSFPSLAPTRAAVLDALIAVSAAPDATRRLGVGPTLGELVRANVHLHEAPAAPAGAVYAGVLYDAIGLAALDAASRRRARAWIVIISALWGAVRPGDRIPPYRLNMCGRLPGFAHLPQVWQEPLADALPAAAGRGVVVDLRAAAYATAWRPSGALAERTVVVKVRRRDDRRGAGSYSAKHTGGLVVRRIVVDAVDPRDPEGLAQALAEHFDVDLAAPKRPGQPWELRVAEALG